MTGLREIGREIALRNALRKRASGVPTYTIPEAASLCSVSPEHLYRLVRAGAFPAVRMRRGSEQGRYVIPAKAVEQLLDAATESSEPVEISDWTSSWDASRAPAGGAA
ncbi:helix-turn-helix domain-containing protein [Kribbella sp. NBC_00889]|uniref:helix-turn-helix domain-containing protein n=1 Tax=Kribbella sp. NBC_00889 TaxID=2975974 RepID=UPI00386929A5|nr:helix-turn-helix domain-containing protein [Kribbella sp. NBC_00889]